MNDIKKIENIVKKIEKVIYKFNNKRNKIDRKINNEINKLLKIRLDMIHQKDELINKKCICMENDKIDKIIDVHIEKNIKYFELNNATNFYTYKELIKHYLLEGIDYKCLKNGKQKWLNNGEKKYFEYGLELGKFILSK